jgi:adenosylcobinamide kinase/adenosylcobinamide-phosphate guanylyltransferase
MAQTILVTGGSRSGKSGYAQARAENCRGRKLFVATCPRIDGEMDERIANHKLERQGKNWHTIEEETHLAKIIDDNYASEVLLIDCLTLWVNNLLYNAQDAIECVDEDRIRRLCDDILLASYRHPGVIFFVTNEIGSGIVPEDSATRRYRDLVGRCNQCIAQGAEEVVLVSCGIPLQLK